MMRITFLLAAVIGCILMHSATALIHVVGGTDGWEVPPSTSFYEDWAKPRTFGVGDKIVFPYRVGGHNVIQVTKEDFDICGHDHVLNQYHKGPTVIQLNTTGDYYFYSGVGTHCEMGQKLHINVINGPGSSGRSYGSSSEHGFEYLEGPAAGPVALVNSASANVAQFLGLVSCFLMVVLFI